MPALKFINRHDTAISLKRLKAGILSNWEMQSQEKMPAGKDEGLPGLGESLPQILDQLIELLTSADPQIQALKNCQVFGDQVGSPLGSVEYALDQVICEYRILRRGIIESLESEGFMDSESLQIIHGFIDQGIQKSAVRHLEIEARRKAEMAEIEAAKNMAERSNEAKSTFLANMSHEIRTPLGAIMGFVGLLHDTELSKGQILNYLSIIDRNSVHLLRIIDDILDLTKVESGKMTIEKVDFSLIEFLDDFSSTMGYKARENGIGFELSSETSIPEYVITDPTRLRQILSNIVGNAIKFTAKGRVELKVVFSEQHLKFLVKDTGRGISREQRPKLFQAFSQADSSTTRKFGGTGLGLVLTKKLCQTLGGDFNLVESEIGQGSIFEARVPIAFREDTKILPLKKIEVTAKAHSDQAQSSIDLCDYKILIVEDSRDNQMLMQLILSKTGAQITLANDGIEGVKYALSQHFDVILMDIQMPNMDGHEAVRVLRLKGYTGPIVALTAHAMKEERELAFESGFSHFLSKPIDRKSLIDLLNKLHSPLSLSL